MTLLFSHENCSLISHEVYLNEIYQSASTNDAAGQKYRIRSDLFELNVPYRQENTNDEKETKKRQRKILEKNSTRVIHEYPTEYALVKHKLELISSPQFTYSSLLTYSSLMNSFTDWKNQRENGIVFENMPRKSVSAE